MLISKLIEIRADQKTSILERNGTQNFQMPQWSMKYGILVAKSKVELERHLPMIQDWGQLDQLISIQVKE